MTQTTFTDNVVIDGSQDITQLTVEGHSAQETALQTWQDSAQTPEAKLTGDGRLQLGDFEPGGMMATDDALFEAHRSSTSIKPKRGLHTLGRISGAVNDALTWTIHELELLGSSGVSSLQTSLRARLTHKNTGTSTSAELRAGDFETINETGVTGARVGKAVGARAAVRNLTGAFLEQAVGEEISVENAGTITNAYGLRIADMPPGVSGSRYALYAGSGTAHFGDDLEMLVQLDTPSGNPPTGFLKLYPKAVAGQPIFYIKDATGIERELSVSGRIAVTDSSTTVDPALMLDLDSEFFKVTDLGGGMAGMALTVSATRRTIVHTIEDALAAPLPGVLRYYNQFGFTRTIRKVFLSVSSAPAGAAIIVDVNKNGTSIFTNQANRPQIAAGQLTGQATTIDVPAWADGEYLTVDVDQVGSTTPGQNLTIHIVVD